MNILFEDEEIQINGETFCLNLEVTITSFPVPGKFDGPWENCYPDEGGDFEVSGALSKEVHPFLSSLKIPELEEKVWKAIDEWARSEKNEDRVWKKVREKELDYTDFDRSGWDD